MSVELWVGAADDPDRVRLGPAVASGAEGVMYRGEVARPSGPLQVAVKMLQPGHLNHLERWTSQWRAQVDLLAHVQVPGLVDVLGGFVGPLPHSRGRANEATSSLYLLMEWVEGTSLDRWARTLVDPEPEQLLLALVPVAAALDLLHSGAATGGERVVHGDVKPANILVRPSGDTVLVDVGSVRGMGVDRGRPSAGGTAGYVAPEVRASGDYGPPADRYSLGAVGYFLLTGEEPPVAADSEQLRDRLMQAPCVCGRQDIADHVAAMLHPNPSERPAFLANWVAQLRRSSLISLPGEAAQPARAPGRNPAAPPRACGPSAAGRAPAEQRTRSALRAVTRIGLPVAVVVLVLVAVLMRSAGEGATGRASGPGAESVELTTQAGQPAEDVGISSTVVPTTLSSTTTVPAAPVTSTTTSTRVAVAKTPSAEVPVSAASLRGKVVFVRAVGGQVDRIFSMNPDGTGQTVLANAPGAQNLRWSPDGTRLAYDDGRNVSILNVDGSGTTRIPVEARQPSWSPDGLRLAVERIDVEVGIYVMDVDGTNSRLVAKDGSDPAWSPDGRRIAFSKFSSQGNSIYTVTPEGNNLARVTSLEGHSDSPAWSIDGSALAFRHNTDLSVIGVDGTGGRPIVFPPGAPEGPSWFPDGSGVAFTLYRGDDDCSIMAVNRDGSGYRQLTSSPTCDRDPAVNAKR